MAETKTIDQFPRDVSIRVASFLSLTDAMNFQNSTRRIRRAIRLNRLHEAVSGDTICEFNEDGDYHNGDNIHLKETFASFLSQGLIHSVKLSFRYKDQGWGNRKGRVHITERNAGDENIGRIVKSSPIAKHHEEKCELVFRSKRGFSYGLCYQVGGGGGHKLFVRDIKLESYVHSEEVV